ncbi:hypothetical protein Agub_g14522, partial [Astrephomene gubernaculifera]
MWSNRPLLPARVCEVAMKKTAAWVLDPASQSQGSPETAQQIVELLLHNMRYSQLAGFTLECMGSILWSVGSMWGSSAARSNQRSRSTNDSDTTPERFPHIDMELGSDCSCLQLPSDQQRVMLQVVQKWLASSETMEWLANKSYTTRLSDLVSLLWGYAALLLVATPDMQQSQRQQQVEGAVGRSKRQPGLDPCKVFAPDTGSTTADGFRVDARPSLDHLARRTADLLTASYGTGEPVAAAAELTDLAWALSVIDQRSAATAQLAEAIAHEVYRQLSNRYSLQAPFTAGDIVKIVQSYAQMGLTDGSIARMYDAVGSHVAKRIRAGHVGAMTRPADCAALLQGFADAGHVSVVVPELLTACAMQISQEVAAFNEASEAAPATTAAAVITSAAVCSNPPHSGATAAAVTSS